MVNTPIGDDALLLGARRDRRGAEENRRQPPSSRQLPSAYVFFAGMAPAAPLQYAYAADPHPEPEGGHRRRRACSGSTGRRTVMWIGFIEFDVLLGDVHSLKGKRSVVRPLVSDLRRTFELSVAEVGHQDLHRRAVVGAGMVGGDRQHVVDVLDRVERYVAARPEVELLSARRRLLSSED
jgi:uncharacterized protein YlxP (DUF503 family)